MLEKDMLCLAFVYIVCSFLSFPSRDDSSFALITTAVVWCFKVFCYPETGSYFWNVGFYQNSVRALAGLIIQ